MELEANFLIIDGELECWKKREEAQEAQIANKKWLKEGDNNSKFFHTIINQRRKASQIDIIQLEDDSVLANSKEIHEGAVKYFQDFLFDTTKRTSLDLSILISMKLLAEANANLTRTPSKNQLKLALFFHFKR